MLVLVMGVAGSGKTLIGGMLARVLGWRFADADDFHPAANVEKMSRGIPLTDVDREPWLDSMREAIVAWEKSGESGVLACSALKRRYRERLAGSSDVTVVFLKGEFGLLHTRLSTRRDHFMKAGMLESQFDDLEEPADAIVVDVSRSPEKIVEEIQKKLAERLRY